MKHDLFILLSQKTKTPFVKLGLEHYIHKLEPFADIKVIEPKHEKARLEKQQFLEKKTVTIVLEERGRQFNSETFAKTWESLMTQKARGISFFIGGPYGFQSPPRTDISFSLSQLTYNHEIVPLVLLEQVYRACSIVKGLPYHHA